MPGLHVLHKRHRHAYASGEFLLGQVEETPAFTNQLTGLARPRACRRMLSVTFGSHLWMPPLLLGREFLPIALLPLFEKRDGEENE
jgi:hypothetical protein